MSNMNIHDSSQINQLNASQKTHKSTLDSTKELSKASLEPMKKVMGTVARESKERANDCRGFINRAWEGKIPQNMAKLAVLVPLMIVQNCKNSMKDVIQEAKSKFIPVAEEKKQQKEVEKFDKYAWGKDGVIKS